MATSFTTNFNFNKPEVGASEDTWGQKLNDNWDDLDALLKSPFVDLGSGVTGVAPVSNGGTGRSSLAAGNLLVGNGTGAVTQLAGTSSGQVPQWDGSTWQVGSLPASGVTGVTASSPLSSTGGATPQISFTGTLSVSNGGTGSTSASGARNNLGIGTLGTQNSNNVNITGGSISGVSISASNVAVTAGAVGSYVFAGKMTEGPVFLGQTVPGSALRTESAVSLIAYPQGGTTGEGFMINRGGGVDLTGTWRCMGNTDANTDAFGLNDPLIMGTLFYRIA